MLFRTLDSQNKFRSDNACVAEDYKELDNNQAVAMNYGIIKNMFIARLGNEPEEIVVECDWYEKVGVNPRTKLTQVRRNPGRFPALCLLSTPRPCPCLRPCPLTVTFDLWHCSLAVTPLTLSHTLCVCVIYVFSVSACVCHGLGARWLPPPHTHSLTPLTITIMPLACLPYTPSPPLPTPLHTCLNV